MMRNRKQARCRDFSGKSPEVISSTLESASERYLNWSFLGVEKGGIKGEVKKGEVVGE